MQQTQVFQRTHNGHDQAADEQERPAKLLEDGVALGSTMHSTCENLQYAQRQAGNPVAC